MHRWPSQLYIEDVQELGLRPESELSSDSQRVVAAMLQMLPGAAEAWGTDEYNAGCFAEALGSFDADTVDGMTLETLNFCVKEVDPRVVRKDSPTLMHLLAFLAEVVAYHAAYSKMREQGIHHEQDSTAAPQRGFEAVDVVRARLCSSIADQHLHDSLRPNWDQTAQSAMQSTENEAGVHRLRYEREYSRSTRAAGLRHQFADAHGGVRISAV